ncbi:hypothetical protein [Mycoplasma sp. P36-A1]|uniref:hypothetical protein n=1 Tax=Mycoplasma sp. P36-A1 TaxID=3252900 RepID=UPI003C2C0AE9
MKKIIDNNKVYIILTLVLSSFIFITYLSENGFFERLYIFVFDNNNFIERNKMSDAPFLKQGTIEYIKYIFEDQSYKKFDFNMIFSFYFFQLLIPLFMSISAYLNFEKYNNIDVYIIYREKSYFKFMLKSITINALKISSAVFTSFLIFYIFMIVVSNGETSLDIHDLNSLPKSFLLDLFGGSFYSNNLYLYYLIEGFIKFFMVIFSYSLFAQSLVFILKNIKEIIFAPFLLYYGLIMFSFVIMDAFPDISLYISPSTIMANSDYADLNSIILLSGALIPLVISMIIMFWRSKNAEI